MRDNSEPFPDRGAELKTIGEMSALYGVSLRTLRFYEDKGLIQPKRVGSQRLYGRKDEVRVQIILKGKRFGFTLSEIEQLILTKVKDCFEFDGAGVDRTTTAVLTPSIVKSKLEELEKAHDSTNEAIAELTAQLH